MKLVIFDIDDTITNETEYLRAHAGAFLRKKYGINASVVNTYAYNLSETYGLSGHFIQQGYTEQEAKKISDEIDKAFWEHHFLKYCIQPIKPEVKKTVDVFRRNGYKIFFLSLRGKTTNSKESLIGYFTRLKIVPFLTMCQLKRGGIIYDELKLVKTYTEKIDYINAMKPDYIFEDQPEVIRQIDEGSIIYCINTPHNEKVVLPNKVFRMDKFDSSKMEMEIKKNQERFDDTPPKFVSKKITTHASLLNKMYIKKILTEVFYTVVTVFGSYFFNKRYYPIVRGKENILTKGAIAFIGNHRNKLDPVVVACSSCRKIHWGALLRMFQGQESLFSTRKNPAACYASAFFITAMGAVPIARNTDENFLRINMNSITLLQQIITWGGAIGLFPEGTINREPQNQNVLPLKSNGIFKLIKDSEGIIQTFSIIWIPDELNIKNQVIINYGIPINTRHRTIKEISQIWDEMINFQIEESKSLIKILKEINENEVDTRVRNIKIKECISQFGREKDYKRGTL